MGFKRWTNDRGGERRNANVPADEKQVCWVEVL